MGRIVAKDRAAGEIFKDLDQIVTKCAAMGGKVAEVAAVEAVPVHLLIGEIEVRLQEAKKSAAPLLAMVDFTRAKAIEAVRLAYDTTWNHVGRPATDTKLSLMYPGGASHYIDGDADNLPWRMEFLARLYDRAIHPKLSKEQNKEAAETIRAAAKVHKDALQAASIPETNVMLLARTRTVMAQTAYSAILNFKRLLKIAGFTEPQIHEIIPDHGPAFAKRAAVRKAAAEALASTASVYPAPAPSALAPTASVYPAPVPSALAPPPPADPPSASPASASPASVSPVPAVSAPAVPVRVSPAPASPALAPLALVPPTPTTPAPASPVLATPALQLQRLQLRRLQLRRLRLRRSWEIRSQAWGRMGSL